MRYIKDKKFEALMSFIIRNCDKNYKFILDNDETFEAVFLTTDEDEEYPELDFYDPNYELFESLLFDNVNGGELIDFNYKNMPKEVYYDGKLVFANGCLV